MPQFNTTITYDCPTCGIEVDVDVEVYYDHESAEPDVGIPSDSCPVYRVELQDRDILSELDKNDVAFLEEEALEHHRDGK